MTSEPPIEPIINPGVPSTQATRTANGYGFTVTEQVPRTPYRILDDREGDCCGRCDLRALATFGPMAIRRGDKTPLEQSMTLIVMNDDLPCIPRCLVDVLHQLDTICLELGGEVRYAVGLKVEVEVPAFINIRD